jgi:DNA ligase D-like protein (predicted 3'-phosphoesterase)
MFLKTYIQKRDFTKTPEPRGSIRDRTLRQGRGLLVYVIQKHQARHLHYDLRLEKDGVLKSWSIPKEPPRKAGIKRLAISVEDHPLSYEKFEGRIPQGEYGAGKVEIWDRGFYKIFEQNKTFWKIEIHGKKLTGIYCLLKFKKNIPSDKNWLFFKMK